MLETMGAIYVAGKVRQVDDDIENKINLVQKYIRDRIIERLHDNKVLSFYHKFYMKTVTRGRRTQ